jgi:hypothetical protein
MEAPDKGHDASYDDYVLTRDVTSLMSAFGCQPVRYHAQANYTQTVEPGDNLNADIGNWIINMAGYSNLESFDLGTGIQVNINREGIAVPALESVRSVALAYGIVGEVEGQYEDLQDSLQETLFSADVQSKQAAASILLSSIQMAGDAIAMGKSIGVLAACLGLCANEYAAIALYVTSIATSAVALAANIAAAEILAAATADVGAIASRMDIDASDSLEIICETVSGSGEGVNTARDKMKATVDIAENKMKEAKKALDTYQKDLKTKLDACSPILDASCTSVKNSYLPFINAEASNGILALYRTQVETSQKLAEINEKIKAAEKKMSETNTGDADVLAKINVDAASACEQAGNRPACEASYQEQYQSGYQEEYQKALAEKNALASLLPAAQTAANAAQKAVNDAHQAIPPIPHPVTDPPTPNPCSAPKYEEKCKPAYDLLTQKRQGTYAWYSLWSDDRYQTEAYKEAKKTLDELPTAPDIACNATINGGGRVVIWRTEGNAGAGEVVRRVDKRSLLQ